MGLSCAIRDRAGAIGINESKISRAADSAGHISAQREFGGRIGVAQQLVGHHYHRGDFLRQDGRALHAELGQRFRRAFTDDGRVNVARESQNGSVERHVAKAWDSIDQRARPR